MNRPVTRTSLAKVLATAAAALALGFTAAASAQPGPGGMGADPGAMIERMLQQAKAKLNLDSSQQVAWDNAVATSKAAHQAMRANRQKVNDALHAELTKPQPDLASVAALADEVAQQNRLQHVGARNQWLTVYSMLSPDQKTIVRDGIASRLARMEAFRDRMRARMQGQPG